MFYFKKFSLSDSHTSMKIGTDAILLGSWVRYKLPSRILDIGSGCGILSFMMAQKYPWAEILGVEIHESAFRDAQENLNRYPLQNKISFINADVSTWKTKGKFDVIISNPPFFENGILPLEKGRRAARFNETLNMETLFEIASKLLSNTASMYLILPFESIQAIQEMVEKFGMSLRRICVVKGNENAKAKRMLLEISKASNESCLQESLTIYKNQGEYTQAFKALCSDFYLNF